LFAAAVLLAGLSGLSEKVDLAGEDCHVFPHSLAEEERAEYQLDESMPSGLQEALESLKADAALKTRMPEDLLNSYIPVKEKEVEVFLQTTDVQRRLRFLDYF
jgi:glutamine synthetase